MKNTEKRQTTVAIELIEPFLFESNALLLCYKVLETFLLKQIKQFSKIYLSKSPYEVKRTTNTI